MSKIRLNINIIGPLPLEIFLPSLLIYASLSYGIKYLKTTNLALLGLNTNYALLEKKIILIETYIKIFLLGYVISSTIIKILLNSSYEGYMCYLNNLKCYLE